jgi:hypothetical protein
MVGAGGIVLKYLYLVVLAWWVVSGTSEVVCGYVLGLVGQRSIARPGDMAPTSASGSRMVGTWVQWGPAARLGCMWWGCSVAKPATILDEKEREKSKKERKKRKNRALICVTMQWGAGHGGVLVVGLAACHLVSEACRFVRQWGIGKLWHL